MKRIVVKLALEDWRPKKKQRDELTDKHGNPCIIREESLMVALYKFMPKSLAVRHSVVYNA